MNEQRHEPAMESEAPKPDWKQKIDARLAQIDQKEAVINGLPTRARVEETSPKLVSSQGALDLEEAMALAESDRQLRAAEARRAVRDAEAIEKANQMARLRDQKVLPPPDDSSLAKLSPRGRANFHASMEGKRRREELEAIITEAPADGIIRSVQQARDVAARLQKERADEFGPEELPS